MKKNCLKWNILYVIYLIKINVYGAQWRFRLLLWKSYYFVQNEHKSRHRNNCSGIFSGINRNYLPSRHNYVKAILFAVFLHRTIGEAYTENASITVTWKESFPKFGNEGRSGKLSNGPSVNHFSNSLSGFRECTSLILFAQVLHVCSRRAWSSVLYPNFVEYSRRLPKGFFLYLNWTRWRHHWLIICWFWT